MTDVTRITIELEDGLQMVFTGREAWTLNALIEAGERGVTPIEYPAPRWSHYVFMLRKAGLIIDTIEERHAGAFKGHHGRYVLRSRFKVTAITHYGRQAA